MPPDKSLHPTLMRRLLLMCFLIMFAGGCSRAPVNEKWIGHYSFPGSEIEFPLHVSIQLKAKQVTGLAVDGNMEKASISWSIETGMHDLLLHPSKPGESKNQDVYYRGKRSGDEIAGEWEHVAEAKGPWSSKNTDLDAAQAIKMLSKPCEPSQTAISSGCANDAQQAHAAGQTNAYAFGLPLMRGVMQRLLT